MKNSQKDLIRRMQKQDALGISRKKREYLHIDRRLYRTVKIAFAVLIPVMFFLYSPLLILVMLAYFVTVCIFNVNGDGWEVFFYNNMGSNESNRIATSEMNLYNDDYDIYIRTLIYSTVQNGENTGTVIAKTFFASYDDYNDGGSQFQTLYDEVRSLVPVQ